VKYSIITSNGQYLNWCLRGIAWQTFTDYELIVVDWDADPPLGDLGQVRVLRWPDRDARWNHSVCRNFATANARAERLVFVNCDCLMAPDLLARADALLDQDPDCQVYWQRFDLNEEGTQVLLDAPFPEGLFDFDEPDPLWGEFHTLSTYGDFLAVGRAGFEELGGYDERMYGWGDYDSNLARRLERWQHRIEWGKGLQLAHLWHPFDEAARHASWEANIAAGGADYQAGEKDLSKNVLNQGPATFDKYREIGEADSWEDPGLWNGEGW